MQRLLWIVLGMACVFSTARADDIGFIEEFALAKDRLVPLKQLIPGAEDYYYYHCLHYLNTEQFEKAEELTKPWHQRFGQTTRLTEIQTRHALLTYDKNPQRTLDYLRNKLGLHFAHQRENPDAPPNLPTALDPAQLARDRLTADALSRHNLLDGFEDSALEWLASAPLNVDQRRNLLQRLTRPDIANLPQAIAADLQAPFSKGFGAFTIHRQLTAAQLEELLKLRPNLLNQTNFVHAWLVRLQPGDDDDWRHDAVKTAAYFDRLWGFVSRLAPMHSSLKAHLLYHRLVLERSRGVYDKERFLEYIKFPRPMPYAARELLESDAARRFPVNLNSDYLAYTLLPAVGNDEPLVRDYLKRLLVDAPSPQEFEPYINDLYLKQVFAETKIENGLGEPEQWASMLSPEQFRQLRERIDIDFAFTNRVDFAADEPVALDLFVKNVPQLIVKVFEINTLNWHRQEQREIDTDINLDGLVANEERTLTSAEAPLRRTALRLELPKLSGAGVWVVDLIGAGKSSRALIRKGRLRPVVSTTGSGQAVRIFDEANRKATDGVVWLGGQEYKADKDGVIALPFSTTPGLKSMVISRGNFACLDRFLHQAEAYKFTAGIHVERESLLARRTAKLVIRPAVTVNGAPTSVALLENVRLMLTSVDVDGIASTQDIPNVKLFEDRETIHEFRTPGRLNSLTVSLRANIKSLITNKPIEVATGETFVLNGIDKTDKIECLQLAQFADKWMLEVRGRTGERKPERAVQLSFKHRDFRDAVPATLKTDAQGRIHLGPLTDIVMVTATGPEGESQTWTLPTDNHTFRQLLHVKAGTPVSIPYLGAAKEPLRSELALFEMLGDAIAADRFASMTIAAGNVEIAALPPGDYEFIYKPANHRMRIRAVDGSIVDGWVLGKRRFMRLPELPALQVGSIVADNDKVSIQLRNASRFARVHVFATRYRPAFSAFADLGKIRDAELTGLYPAKALSAYLTGRNIGDEYRYVIDRKLQKKRPGVMLERPQLLLNPWAIRKTDTGEQAATGGDAFDRKSVVSPSEAAPAPMGQPQSAPLAGGDYANLDFLADAAAVELNLVPNKDGLLQVPMKDIGPHAMIHVVAVDPLSTTYRSIALPEREAAHLDLRLASGLDPKGHFAQQKKISVLAAGQSLTVADIASGRFEAIDSLARLYLLFTTLSKDPKLAEFEFLLNWPKLTGEEKRAQYSKFACHELTFFLSKKDPEFFKTAILPYLANKKDKTFLDRWLLEENLAASLEPWHYERLNVFERILLGRRIPGEAPKTARHLNDLFALLPPNVERFVQLFDTALQSDSMAATDSLGRALPSPHHMRDDVQFLPKTAGGPTGAIDPKSNFSGAAEAGGLGGGAGGRRMLGGFKMESDKAPGAPIAGKPAMPAAEPLAAEQLRKKALASAPARRRALAGQARGGRAESKDDAKEKSDDEGGAVELRQEMFYRQQRGREGYAALFRKVDPTEEWAENNYHRLRNVEQSADLVGVSSFWLDYARHDGSAAFLSRFLAEPSRNFTEMMYAMAVLDLPFESPKLATKFDGLKMTVTAAQPLVAFHEEIEPTAAPAVQTPILVSQNFYRQGERYRTDNGEQVDKFVSGEFVAQTVYGCQVVVTNPTSARQKLTALLQIPVGAMPVQGGQFTKSVMLSIEPYRTQTIDYYFYFPLPGQFAHFPVHVAKAEKTIAASAPVSFNVVAKPTKIDTESWQFVSQNGTAEQVLAFLSRENVRSLDLDKIAFRMAERSFFDSALKLLDERHQFNATLWSYGIKHNAAPAIREFLAHADNIVAECAGPLDSALLAIDPIARNQFEHLEYRPLVNARAHALGKRRQIVNDKLLEQYHRFMKQLSYRRTLTDADQLAATYYLLLQDRFEEALERFAAVDAAKIATKLQYDYCAAWLDLLQDEPKRARSIATAHANHPVDRWRKLFAAIVSQLDEIEGKSGKLADTEDRNLRQAELAAKEPSFDFDVAGGKIELSWQNIDAVRINYYLMDIELLFSRNPFVQQTGGQFSSIRPNESQDLALPANQRKSGVPLPASLAGKNVLVEIIAAGKTRSKPYFANALAVRLMENYGQVRVSETAAGKPVAKAYVKVYVRLADGQVKFHKDGYTDLRGRFDYASVSTPETSPIARYAILVLTEDRGAQIHEAAPPTQ